MAKQESNSTPKEKKSKKTKESTKKVELTTDAVANKEQDILTGPTQTNASTSNSSTSSTKPIQSTTSISGQNDSGAGETINRSSTPGSTTSINTTTNVAPGTSPTHPK